MNILKNVVSSPVPPQAMTKYLRLKIIKCENLMEGDGQIDAFAMFRYDSNWKSTSVHPTSRNPAWKEIFEVEVTPDSTLEFLIWDKNLITKAFLGHAEVNLDDKSNFDKELKLNLGSRPDSKDVVTSGVLYIQLHWIDVDDKNLPKDFQKEAGALQVTVIEAKNLLPPKSGTSCLYCKVSVGKSYQKTQFIKGLLCPEWNESFFFSTKGDKQLPPKIEFEIKDDNLISKNTIVGNAEFPTNLLKNDEAVDTWLPLGKTGMIHVNIRHCRNAFARESRNIKGYNTTRKIIKTTGHKLSTSTKTTAGYAFIRLPVRVIVCTCSILRDRLIRNNMDGSVTATIGFPQFRFSWNVKTKTAEPVHPLQFMSLDPNQSAEDKDQEKLLSKLVGLIADRLLSIAKIMAHQMQEMKASGVIGIRLRATYLAPPSPLSPVTGMPTPIKFSMGMKVKTDSVPRLDKEFEGEITEVVLEEQKKEIEKIPDLADVDIETENKRFNEKNKKQTGCLRVSVIQGKGFVRVHNDQEEKDKEKEKEDALNPFLVVNGDRYSQKTQVKKGELEPVWKEEILFPTDPETGLPPPFLHLELHHEDKPPSKYFFERMYNYSSQCLTYNSIAQAVVPLNDIVYHPKEQRDVWVGLERSKKFDEKGVLSQPPEKMAFSDEGDAGAVHLSVVYDPDAPRPPPLPLRSKIDQIQDVTGQAVSNTKEKGVIASVIRMCTKVMVHVSNALRKRCIERGIAGSVCSYFSLGPVMLIFELDTDESEVKAQAKSTDFVKQVVGDTQEVDDVKNLAQSLVDKVVDVLLDGISLASHEMHRQHTKGHIWFGQFLALPTVVVPADLLVGLYVDSESVPLRYQVETKDINIDSLLCEQAALAEGETKTEKKKSDKKGALSVTIVQARDLSIADSDSSDPYCKVVVEDDYQYTEVIQESIAPVWNQTFKFPAPEDKMPKTVKFKVYDDNIIYSDVKLGTAVVDISQIEPHKPLELWVPLNPKGEVRIVIVYSPEAERPELEYPSIFGMLSSGAAKKMKQSGKRTGKATIRTGFRVAIAGAMLSRNRIQGRGFDGKGMTKVTAVLWQMGVSVKTDDSKLSPLTEKREPGGVVRCINRVLDMLIDALVVACEEVKRVNAKGTIKFKATAGLPPPLVNYFSLSSGLAIDSDSIDNHNRSKLNKPITNVDQFGIQKAITNK